MSQQKIQLDKFNMPITSRINTGNPPSPSVPSWQWGNRQHLRANHIKVSRANVSSPYSLSGIATAEGTMGNGQTLEFQTTLVPQAPHKYEMNFAIPYLAIFWNTLGVGSLQIWPNLGAGIPGTAFITTGWFDWQLFALQTLGSVPACFSGQITNNSMGNGTIQFISQWQYANFNTGTASQT